MIGFRQIRIYAAYVWQRSNRFRRSDLYQFKPRRASLAASGLLLRHWLLALHFPQLAQFAVQAVPQGAFRAKLVQKGLGPRKNILINLMSAKKGPPRSLNFVFG